MKIGEHNPKSKPKSDERCGNKYHKLFNNPKGLEEKNSCYPIMTQ